MIENHTARYKRKKRRYNLLTSEGPFPAEQNMLQFFSGGGRGELLDHLGTHARNSDDPIVVTGEHGSGKTLLGMVLADRLKHKFSVIRFDQITLSSEALLEFLIGIITRDHPPQPTFHLPYLPAPDTQESVHQAPDRSSVQTTLRLQTGTQTTTTWRVPGSAAGRFCLESLRLVVSEHIENARPYLLIIDSPDSLDAETLALLEELKTIRISGYPLFSVLVLQLCDVPGPLSNTLDEDAVSHTWPFETHNLRRLSLSEIHDYLQHHMMLFDYSQRHMFSREMSYFIADRSEGVYGAINDIARSAFLLAGINNSSQVSLSHLIAVSSPQYNQAPKSERIGYIARSGFRFAVLVSGIVLLFSAGIMLVAS